MIADKELIRERELRIRSYLKDLKTFADISEDEFRRNKERQYAVLHALQLAIEATIEIGTHKGLSIQESVFRKSGNDNEMSLM